MERKDSTRTFCKFDKPKNMDFSAKGRAFYSAEGFGLAYQNLNDEEWNLAAIASRLLFPYEDGQPTDGLAGEFEPRMQDAVKDSIQQVVGVRTVLWYMKQNSPFRFYDALDSNKEDSDSLEISKFWGGRFFKVLVMARCLAWRANHRVEGNRIFPHLTAEQVNYIKQVKKA
jgi:hypothetical protein